jgi:Transglutaminase-like superfamily
METWRRFRALPAPERKLVREAAARLTSVWIGLKVYGYKRLRERIENSPKSATSSSLALDSTTQIATARSIAKSEASASRHLFFSPNCLVRSLALVAMLRRRGMQPELRIGARSDAGNFEAHAWVELHGEVLNDARGEHAHFVPFEEDLASPEPNAAAGTRSR